MIFNEVVVLISTIEVSRFLITYSSFTCDSAAVCPSQSRSSGGHSYCSSSSFGKQLDLSSSAKNYWAKKLLAREVFVSMTRVPWASS